MITTLIEKIKEKSNLSEEEIQERIKKKMNQLAGLISEQGAAHIVANDLGIRLFPAASALKIKDLTPGLRNVELTARVVRKYTLREFQKDTLKGKVASFLAADETGQIRVVLWHNATKDFEILKENDVVRVVSAYLKENNGFKELHLNEKSKLLINPANATIAELTPQQLQQQQFVAVRKRIHELKENDTNIEIVGTILQVFDIKFFEICAQCGKKVLQKEASSVCAEHGVVSPEYSYVVNLFLDDGTDNIRTVFFRNQVQKLLKKKEEEILLYRLAPEAFQQVKNELLGEMIKVVGRTTKNAMFDRLEFMSNFVFRDLNPEEEIKKLEAELEDSKDVRG